MGIDDLHWRSIAETADLLREGAVTSAGLTEALLERIRTDRAGAARVRWRDGGVRSAGGAGRRPAVCPGGVSRPVAGDPGGGQGPVQTAGFPTSAGSRALEGHVPTRDAVVVRRLRDGGAVLIGKTVTHEFAWGQDMPQTRNAWDQRCYPGGSSAGSGVAVAAGTAYGAIGTDTGGSIRVPAAVNGVVGLKPTFGRVSRTGVFPMSPTLDTVGTLTRTARDAALMLGVIAGRLDPERPRCDRRAGRRLRGAARPGSGPGPNRRRARLLLLRRGRPRCARRGRTRDRATRGPRGDDGRSDDRRPRSRSYRLGWRSCSATAANGIKVCFERAGPTTFARREP